VDYPIREKYTDLVRTTLIKMAFRLTSLVSGMGEYADSIEQVLMEYKEKTSAMAQSVAGKFSKTSLEKYAHNKLEQLKNIDVLPYITSLEMTEEYSNTLDSVRSTAQSGLKYAWERPELDMIRGNLNSIYQQGAWAANYWDIKENLKTSLKNIMTLMKEIIEEELQEMHSECSTLNKYKNTFVSPIKITYWAPQQAEVQAEVTLPIDVHRLDEVPDISPVVKKVENTAQKFASGVAVYLPDQSTWESIKQTVSEMLPAVAEDDEAEQFKKFKPTRKMKKNKKGGKKLKKMKKLRQ